MRCKRLDGPDVGAAGLSALKNWAEYEWTVNSNEAVFIQCRDGCRLYRSTIIHHHHEAVKHKL